MAHAGGGAEMPKNLSDLPWRPQRFSVVVDKPRSPVVGPARFRDLATILPEKAVVKRRSALGRFLGALAVVVGVVAVPLLLVQGGDSVAPVVVDPTPLAAFTTVEGAAPGPSIFDISALLIGEWEGELCPSGEDTVPVSVEFSSDATGELLYSMVTADESGVDTMLAQGHCTVSGEVVTFGDMVEIPGGSSRFGGDLVAEFDYGVLRGALADVATGGGSWWLEPAG